MNELIVTLILISIVVIGGIAASLLPLKNHEALWRRMVIPFTGAFLLGVVISHLLPEIFAESDKTVALFVLLGFAVQIMLDVFSKGIEHGHLHFHDHNIGRQVIPILLALSVHSFLEGLPLGHHGHSHGYDHAAGDVFLWAIVFHKLPAAFTLATLLFLAYKSRVRAWVLLIVFGLMTPLGTWVAHFISLGETAHQYILALVGGSLLHVSTTIIFEVDSKGSHQISLDRLLAILFGVVIAYVSS